MYVSLAFVYTGLALWLAVFWALVLLPIVFVAVQYFVIAGEERYLERKFGQAYLDYKTRVRRWL
jgi:protein-S-isoprenylcysteine O-methyltransferase Ste14